MFSFLKIIINKIIDFLYLPFKKLIPFEIFRYGCVGGGNMILDTLLYYIFYHYVFDEQIFDLGFIAFTPLIASYVFVFPITFITGFLLNKYIAFPNSYLKNKSQFFRYILTVTGSIILHYFILKFFGQVLEFWPLISKILTVCIVTVYSFCVQKFFSFKTKK
ncbi:MAG: GtrA family protein [Bacteroidales bacterium]|jgi:putative flippase GtrA|nr:GtrA family protein [Bacteroidales bacterium]